MKLLNRVKVDLAEVARRWEAAVPDSWGEVGGGGKPRFANVYGDSDDEFLANWPDVLGPMVVLAEHLSSVLFDGDKLDLEDPWVKRNYVDPTDRVARALIAFDFGK